MNIFATDSDPVLAARALDDRRVGKLLVETAQILSTALDDMNSWRSNLYRPTHKNHPCVRWASRSRHNFNWLVLHGLGLADEFKYRFSRTHASRTVVLNAAEIFTGVPLDGLTMTPFPNCTNLPGQYGTPQLYQRYLNETKWAGKDPTWRRRGAPSWYRRIEEKVA